jgi:hypothetical protein
MLAQRTWLEVTAMIVVAGGLLFVIGRAAAADRRRWVRLRARGRGSASVAFAAMEDMFSASASQSRQLLEEQKRVGQPAPTPGDWLDGEPSVTGRFAGKLTMSVNGSGTVDAPCHNERGVAVEPFFELATGD